MFYHHVRTNVTLLYNCVNTITLATLLIGKEYLLFAAIVPSIVVPYTLIQQVKLHNKFILSMLIL